MLKIYYSMAFLEDIGKFFSGEDNNVQLIGRQGAVISAHSGIQRLSEREICVCLGKNCLVLTGEDLHIVCATQYEIYVKGKIKSVCFNE